MIHRAAGIVLVLLAACSSTSTPPPDDTGVRGIALIGPQCPVVREGEECPDAPVQTTLAIVRDGSEDVVVTVETGVDGRFEAALEPGDYVIQPAEGADPPGGLPQLVAVPFTVRAGEFTEVTVSFDSGIR